MSAGVGAKSLPPGAVRGKSDRAREQVAFDDLVDQAGCFGLGGGDRFAVGAHLEGQLDSREAGQALGAAGAGDDAEEYFGLPDLRHRLAHGATSSASGAFIPRPAGSDRHAEVAGHGDFHPAAERVAVKRCDERFRRVLHAPEQRVCGGRAREGILARLQRIEHFDVRAGDEGRARADKDDGVSDGVGIRARDRFVDAGPDGGTERVDRRVVDRHDRDAVSDVVTHGTNIKSRVGHSRLAYHASDSPP